MDEQSDLRAVLFDFDGTLVYLPTNYDKIRDRLKKLFSIFNVYSDFNPIIESIKCSLNELRHSKSQEVITKIKERAFTIIEIEELQAAENARVVDGAPEILSSLRESSILIAIVSRNSRSCIERCLYKFNMPWPSLIVAREDTAELKPNPQHFRIALEKLGVETAETVVIGNSYHDIDGARELGCKAILIEGSNNKLLQQHRQPDFELQSLSEILEIPSLPLSKEKWCKNTGC